MTTRAKTKANRVRQVETKGAEPPAVAPSWLAPVGLGLVLLLTLVIYYPCYNGTPLWDDDAHLTRPDLQSVDGLRRIWTELTATQQYYPLLHSTFWLEHRLWGDAVVGYHLINLFWHLCAVALLYLILVRLEVAGALLAAAIFAVHPVMVESVAWISEQKNTLSAVFYLSAMLTYLSFDSSRRRFQYILALGLFCLGLMTKTVTATLPAALLVIFWWQRGTIYWKRDILPLVPFFVLGAAGGVLTAWVERKLIGAEGADFELGFIERGLLAGRVIWFYFGKLVWPVNLTFVYEHWKIDPAIWWQWLFPIAAAGVFAALWALRIKTRGPLACWLLFVGTLAPVLGFLNVYPFIFSYVADHFQYLASVGIIVLVAACIMRGVNRMPAGMRPTGIVLCLALIGTLAAITFQQTRIYLNNDRLYRATLDRNPQCWLAYNNLGQLLETKDAAAATAQFQIALQLRPNYPEAHNNLGLQLYQTGRSQEAVDHFRTALKLKPDFAAAHSNLGIALYFLGQVPEAAEHFRRAVDIRPHDAKSHARYANALSATGKMDEAIAHYKEAIRIRPDLGEVHYRFAEVLRQRGQLAEAIEHFQAAIESMPKIIDVYIDLAATFAALGRSEMATATAEQGIEVARSTNQQRLANKLGDWLKHYRLELNRGNAKYAPANAVLELKQSP